MQQPLNNQRRAGFTLIEMLVVIAVTSVVGVAISGAIQSFYQKNAFLLEQTSALDSARGGIVDAVRTLRQASYGDDGSYPISTAGTSTVTFYSDVDNDKAVEKVRYYLVNTTLYRGVTKSSGFPPTYTGQPEAITTVSAYVRNPVTVPIFTYLDANGTQLPTVGTNIAAISAIGITLYTDLNPNRAPNVFELTETATLRNLQVR
jgi:prepilin-type N-terminal cleavage/methylation domain-containing protein